MNLLLYVYVEKLPYSKFGFRHMYFLVHFTMLGSFVWLGAQLLAFSSHIEQLLPSFFIRFMFCFFFELCDSIRMISYQCDKYAPHAVNSLNVESNYNSLHYGSQTCITPISFFYALPSPSILTCKIWTTFKAPPIA